MLHCHPPYLPSTLSTPSSPCPHLARSTPFLPSWRNCIVNMTKWMRNCHTTSIFLVYKYHKKKQLRILFFCIDFFRSIVYFTHDKLIMMFASGKRKPLFSLKSIYVMPRGVRADKNLCELLRYCTMFAHTCHSFYLCFFHLLKITNTNNNSGRKNKQVKKRRNHA